MTEDHDLDHVTAVGLGFDKLFGVPITLWCAKSAWLKNSVRVARGPGARRCAVRPER
jgi:hypothetical protein